MINKAINRYEDSGWLVLTNEKTIETKAN